MVINDACAGGPPTIDSLQRIRELVRTGQAAYLDHWGNGRFVVGENGSWHYEGFVNLFQAVHEAMRAVDPTIPPGLQPHALDPVVVARFFGIPLEDLNWQGEEASAVDWQSRVRSKTVSGPDPQRPGRRPPPSTGQSGLLRLRECAAVLGHSESSLRRAIKDGRLRAHTIGRGRKRPTYGIYRADLEGFIEASRVQPPDPPRVPTIGVRRKSRHFS
jgi:excisionase family DNA binding protein